MEKSSKNAKLAEVKQGLAAKWAKRARATKSVPEKKVLEGRAAKYRRQAADIQRKG